MDASVNQLGGNPPNPVWWRCSNCAVCVVCESEIVGSVGHL